MTLGGGTAVPLPFHRCRTGAKSYGLGIPAQPPPRPACESANGKVGTTASLNRLCLISGGWSSFISISSLFYLWKLIWPSLCTRLCTGELCAEENLEVAKKPRQTLFLRSLSAHL